MDGKRRGSVADCQQIFKGEGRFRARDGQKAFTGQAGCEPLEIGSYRTVGESNREKCGNPRGDNENQKRVQARRSSPMAKAHRAEKFQQHMRSVHRRNLGGFKTRLNAELRSGA